MRPSECHGDYCVVPNSQQKRVALKLIALPSVFHGDYCVVPNSQKLRAALKLLALPSVSHGGYCTDQFTAESSSTQAPRANICVS